jgi:hypothetical protein
MSRHPVVVSDMGQIGLPSEILIRSPLVTLIAHQAIVIGCCAVA